VKYSNVAYLIEKFYLKKAIRDDDFEQLLYNSFDRGLPLLISLECGKVYIGYPLLAFDPTSTRSALTIMPFLSGYRNKDDHGLVIATNYFDVLSKIELQSEPESGDSTNMKIEDFNVVIPQNQIIYSHMFDLETYYDNFEVMLPSVENHPNDEM